MKRATVLMILFGAGSAIASTITLQSNGTTPESCESSLVCEWNTGLTNTMTSNLALPDTPGTLAWAQPGDGAEWVSYADTGGHWSGPGQTGTWEVPDVAPNSGCTSLPCTPTSEFFEQFTDNNSDVMLTLTVWADDDVAVYVISGDTKTLLIAPTFTASSIGFCDAPNPTYALGASECANGEEIVNYSLPSGTNTLEFDVYQQSGGTFGVMWDGTVTDVAPAPEPASLLLLGTGIAALGILRRKRAF